ncbi:MAG TPA: V-type ATP synthase subunit F [Clostridia bacterium]|nr:V-type ATP synthase subunit F [Clostridia bacterium]
MADRLLRIGAVGEEDAILAFKAIGAVVIPANTSAEVGSALHRLAKDGIPLIFITEEAAKMAAEAVSKYEQTMETAVIPIPGIRGSDGYGAQQVRATLIKAIGADILSKQD